MKKLFVRRALLGLCVAGGVLFGAGAVQADTKEWYYDWRYRHWQTLDFQPYVEPYNTTHMPMAKVQPWIYPSGQTTPRELVATYRRAELMNKFYVDDDLGVSVLEVGSNFYRLSSTEKRKFITTIDRLYMVTRSQQGVLFLKDWNTKRAVGQFTSRGLMLF